MQYREVLNLKKKYMIREKNIVARTFLNIIKVVKYEKVLLGMS